MKPDFQRVLALSNCGFMPFAAGPERPGAMLAVLA
jgi:hypothetical protein